jgi:hypothetical protein
LYGASNYICIHSRKKQRFPDVCGFEPGFDLVQFERRLCELVDAQGFKSFLSFSWREAQTLALTVGQRTGGLARLGRPEIIGGDSLCDEASKTANMCFCSCGTFGLKALHE